MKGDEVKNNHTIPTMEKLFSKEMNNQDKQAYVHLLEKYWQVRMTMKKYPTLLKRSGSLATDIEQLLSAVDTLLNQIIRE